MRTAVILTCLALLSACTGCAVSDMLFAVFGDHYSGGGTTREEKKYHFDRQVEASQDYGSWNP